MLKKIRARLNITKKDPMISRESIEYAYRMFLDREPENEAAVHHHQKLKDLKALRNNFLNSDEFFFKHCKQFAIRLFRESLYAPKLVIDFDTDQEQEDRMVAHLRKIWTRLGLEEPYWSVLTANDYTSVNITQNIRRFYESGKVEAEGLESILLRNDIDPDILTTCLEFGCGVGRVTRWLALKFGHVYAFDISSSHINVARKYLNENNVKNVDLILLQSLDEIDKPMKIDLIYSILVLQHNPPPIIAYILKKLLKSLNAGGVAVFQVPTYVKGYNFTIEGYLGWIDRNSEMEFHVLPQKKIFKIAEETDCAILEVIRYPATDDLNHVSNLFVVQKKYLNRS